MKKILIALTAIALSFGAMAQTKTADTTAHKKNTKSMNKKSPKVEHQMKSSLEMTGGKMMVLENGKTMAMTEKKTFPNGTSVMPDGSVEMKGGKKVMLKEGERVSSEGKIKTTPVKKAKMKTTKKM